MSSIARDRSPFGMRAVQAMLLALGAVALAPAPAQAAAAATVASREAPNEIAREIERRVDSDIRPFYAARDYRPLWLDQSGRVAPAANVLLARLESAELDRINKKKLKTRSLLKALRRAQSGDPDDLARAELKLSDTYVRYVSAMRDAPHSPMIYESEALAPVVPTPAAALAMAASHVSLQQHLAEMAWMHPLYAPLRDALLDRRLPDRQRQQIWQNLDRVRALPATAAERYVLVDAAAARLWMYENGKPVDSMRVVVGKPATPTPTMAGFLRFATVNPYWNVPVDLARDTIANNVLDKGHGYLRARGYQVLSDWSADPDVVDPRTVDWHAVAAGLQQVRVRQLPGGNNFMGKVKFEFPNPLGIYLHDTPDKHLLRHDMRQLSSGCVRVEDADRLGRWLLQKPLPRPGRKPEQRIDLPQLVPVYITYLTAMPIDGKITFRSDVYGRDNARIAHRD